MTVNYFIQNEKGLFTKEILKFPEQPRFQNLDEGFGTIMGRIWSGLDTSGNFLLSGINRALK